MASILFPSYAYQNVPTYGVQVVQTQAALTALGSTWQTTPVQIPSSNIPFDPGFPDTDTRLQQMLIELRALNQAYNVTNLGLVDDPLVLRADILANDSSLSS
jgi:hypothetical protein